MKHVLMRFLNLSCILCLLLLYSCKDNDYDWDDIDKSGEISLPPFLIGSFDTIWIKDLVELPTIPPIDLPGGEAKIAYEYIFEDLFNENLIENFFYEGNEVSLSGLADVLILNKNLNLSLGVSFDVLDEERAVIEEIKIPDQSHFVYGPNQEIKIQIASEYMKYFEQRFARHLRAVIVLKANSISVGNKDYLLLKEIVMKATAMHIEW